VPVTAGPWSGVSLPKDAKHASFIEDVAVPPERLPEFVAVFQEILVDHGTFASFYGHAGPGCLHVRPLADTKTVEGVETVRAISNEVSNPAIEYGGSVSGEYGDGQLGVTADTVLADRIAGAR